MTRCLTCASSWGGGRHRRWRTTARRRCATPAPRWWRRRWPRRGPTSVDLWRFRACLCPNWRSSVPHKGTMHPMADWTAAFKYAFRTLRRQPTFVFVAVLTLALGIGANTAIFSVIKTVVLNPLPYEDPEKIAILWEVNPDGNQGPVSVPTFEDWQREAKTFESM